MNKIALGVIGLGGMGRWHIENLGKYPQISIIALCDVNEEALQEVGDSLNISMDKRYKVPADLVNDQDSQAIVSVTPNNIHKNIENGEIIHEVLHVPDSFHRNQWDDFVLMLEGHPPAELSTFMDGYTKNGLLLLFLPNGKYRWFSRKHCAQCLGRASFACQSVFPFGRMLIMTRFQYRKNWPL